MLSLVRPSGVESAAGLWRVGERAFSSAALPTDIKRAATLLTFKTRSPATAGIANRPLLFLEHRIPMPELFTVRRFTRVLEAGKYGCPY